MGLESRKGMEVQVVDVRKFLESEKKGLGGHNMVGRSLKVLP